MVLLGCFVCLPPLVVGISTCTHRPIRPCHLESPISPTIFQSEEGPAGSEGSPSSRVSKGPIRSAGTFAEKRKVGQETSLGQASQARPNGTFCATCSCSQAGSFRTCRAKEETMNPRFSSQYFGTSSRCSLKSFAFLCFF